MDLDKIDIEIDVDDLQMDVDTMIPLGLVINELVSNAMKYAYASRKGSLSVSLKKRKDLYTLVVHDSGPGFEDETLAESGSLGYKIVNAFIKKLKATLSIENRNGAYVRIDIPK